MFKKVVLGLGRIFSPDDIRLGRRVGETFQDVSIHLRYTNPNLKESRAVICIEVKKPETSGLKECIKDRKINRKLEESIKQALGYAYASYYIRNQIMLKPICILTDGDFIAFLDADETAEKNTRTLTKFPDSRVFVFSNEILMAKFSWLKDARIEGLISSEKSVFRPYAIESLKSEDTCDSKLAHDLLKTYSVFTSKKIEPKLAIDYTMQCFLLLVLRNCGFVSVSEMDHKVGDLRDQNWLRDVLSKYFSNNFAKVQESHVSHFISAYNSTKMYDVRVDAMPQEELGYAYEAFIKKTKKVKSTEFYTPDFLIREVLDELSPTIDDIIFDPTCGCGSFLIAAARSVFHKQVNTFDDLKRLSKFLTNNIYGNDRDFYASCIAKAALLSLFVERLGIDPTIIKLKFPTVRDNFTTEDFFDFKWKGRRKPTLVIGNAPWGDVSSDSQSFKDIVETKDRWEKIQKIRGNKDDRHEISGSIVLKCLDDFGGTRDFRMGMLIKQQILVKGKDLFLEDERVEKCYFFDYGPLQLFKHTASLTAIAFFGRGEKKGVIPKFPISNTKFGPMVKLSDLGCTIRKGPDTGKNEIWADLATNTALKSLVVECLARDSNSQPLTRPRTYEIVYLAPPNKENIKDRAYQLAHNLLEENLSYDQKKALRGVTTGSKSKSGQKKKKSGRKFPFTWRRPIDNELLVPESWKLIIPFQWTGVEPGKSRLPLNCTTDAVVIRDCHVCVGFPHNIPEFMVVNTAAWLASRFFSESLELLCSRQILKRLSGGYELNPTYCEQIFVPFKILNSTALFRVASQIIGRTTVTEENLKNLDQVIGAILNKEEVTQLLRKERTAKLLKRALAVLEKVRLKQTRSVV